MCLQEQPRQGPLQHLTFSHPLQVYKPTSAYSAYVLALQEQPRQGPLQQLQLLIGALQHESMAVRHVALGEVRSFLLQHKTFMSDAMSGLLSCSGPAALPQDANNKADSGAAAGNGQQQQQQQKGKGGKAGSGDGSSSSKLAPGQCRELVSQLLAALLASCANLPRVHSGHPRSHMVQSMKQR